MQKIFAKYLKVISINFLIFLLLIVISEIIFGDWFKNNFKFKINSERNINKLYEFKFSNYEGISRYKRDKFGFRVEEQINPSEIDIVFLGGSTTNEKFTNYKVKSIPKGDNKYYSIAAASILAKEYHDEHILIRYPMTLDKMEYLTGEPPRVQKFSK